AVRDADEAVRDAGVVREVPPPVRDLDVVATENVDDRRTTLRKLRDLLRRSGVPESNEHEGHDIPGMVIPADFAALKRADGAAFDRLFTKDAREYLTQSVLVAKSEQKAGTDQETRAFAAAMEKNHSGQLTRLEP
ncbi:DUF305 domain-containing protein, partial [Streptosporangium sp. NPDC048865]|uniref:DUF305 domain-containing protein n=1 Tax=Streptosporangium sp. NPDC048865 TaxID=3155766 RepID=UPI0034215CB0